MYVYTDVTEAGHDVWGEPDGSIFVDGSYVDHAPHTMMFLRAVDGPDDRPIVIGKLGNGAGTYLCWDGVYGKVLGPNHGNQAHGLWYSPEGELFAVYVVPEGHVWSHINPRTGVVLESQTLPFPWPYTPSTGFLDILAYGQVAWTHENSISPEGLSWPLRRGDWTFGQSNLWYGAGAYQHSTGKMFVAWQGDTQVPVRGNSRGAVAVSATPDRPLFVVPPYKEYVEPAPTVAPYATPKLVGTVWANSDRYGYHMHMGNAETFFGGDYAQVQAKGPVIKGANALNVPKGKVIGLWNDDAITAPDPTLPTFAYWDGRVYATPLNFREGIDVRLFQAYPAPGESPAAFEAAIAAQLDRFTGPKVIMTAFYDRNGTIDPLPYMSSYDRLLRRSDVSGMLCFDYARSGILFDSRREAWYNAFCLATPSLPDFSAPPVPEEPLMPYLVKAKRAVNTGDPNRLTDEIYDVFKVTEEVKDGTLYLNLVDGKKLSMQPDGTLQTRNHDVYREWEQFAKTPKGYVSVAHGEKYGLVNF